MGGLGFGHFWGIVGVTTVTTLNKPLRGPEGSCKNRFDSNVWPGTGRKDTP